MKRAWMGRFVGVWLSCLATACIGADGAEGLPMEEPEIERIDQAVGDTVLVASFTGAPLSVAYANGHVYVSRMSGCDRTLQAVNLATGAVRTLLSGCRDLLSLAADGTHVYYVERTRGQSPTVAIRRVNHTGTPSEQTIVSTPGVQTDRLFLDGTNLYFSNRSSIRRIDRSGNSAVTTLVVDQANLLGIEPGFWFTPATVFYEVGTGPSRTVRSISSSGTSQRTYGTRPARNGLGGIPAPHGFVWSDSHLYFFDTGSAVRMDRLTGNIVQIAQPSTGIALTNDYVYLSMQEFVRGRLYRAPVDGAFAISEQIRNAQAVPQHPHVTMVGGARNLYWLEGMHLLNPQTRVYRASLAFDE